VRAVKEKKSDLIARRKAAPNIAKWNDKAKEIRKPAVLKNPTAPSSSSASTAATAPAHLVLLLEHAHLPLPNAY